MTDAELQGVAAQVLNMAKRDIERGRFNFLFAAYHVSDTPPLHRMEKIEALVVERLGEDWLNSGEAKDIGFHVLRLAVDMLPPDAVVIATGANSFKATPRLRALPEARQRALLNGGHDKQHQAVAEGLLEVCDAIVAIVQTKERVLQYVQEIGPHGPTGKPDAQFYPQADFSGRMKMFRSVRHKSV
jgi:hypothetical protein